MRLVSTSDDLPRGVVLSPISDANAALLQGVQDTGTTRQLAAVDEADLTAVGLLAACRPGRSQITPSEQAAATDQLVARGLAEREPWGAGPVRPAGDLLLYAQLSLDPRAHLGLTNSWIEPELPLAARERRTISLLTEVLPGSGLACVATSAVPAVDPPASVSLKIELIRLDVLVTTVVEATFAPLGNGTVRATVVAFVEPFDDTLAPSRLRVRPSGRGELESSKRGRFGTRTRRTEVDRDDYTAHLRERLMIAGRVGAR